MAIFITADSKILVQGMTGSEGTKHTRRMVASGTNVVAGVTPGKGGQDVDGIPIFNNVGEAMAATGANVSVVFVPPKFAKAAVIEAIDAQIPLCVVITEGIAVHDTAVFFQYAENSGKTRLVGPNCPGLISPGLSNAGIIPGDITQKGRIGLVSKSGTLTYQMMFELKIHVMHQPGPHTQRNHQPGQFHVNPQQGQKGQKEMPENNQQPDLPPRSLFPEHIPEGFFGYVCIPDDEILGKMDVRVKHGERKEKGPQEIELSFLNHLAQRSLPLQDQGDDVDRCDREPDTPGEIIHTIHRGEPLMLQ